MKKYVIIGVESFHMHPGGKAIMIKANPANETMPELSKMFGKTYYQWSLTENKETEYFVEPFSQQKLNRILQIAKESQSPEHNDSFWCPFMGDYYDAIMQDESGSNISIHKSIVF